MLSRATETGPKWKFAANISSRDIVALIQSYKYGTGMLFVLCRAAE